MPKAKREKKLRDGPYQNVQRPHRQRRPSVRLLDAIDEEELQEADPDIDALVPPLVTYDDDNDWLPSVPGRPSPFTTTWEAVYGHRTWSSPMFIVGCQEGCGKDILLNSKLQEINGRSTPHGRPRRPPVCHDVSWAALEVSMLNLQSKQEQLQKKPVALRPDFIRAVCWEPSNLRPGHNACNALGTKTTAQNVSKTELTAADFLVDKVRTAWSGSIWQM